MYIQFANGEGKTEDKEVCRTRGCLNTKIHTIVDGLDIPVKLLLSAETDNDMFMP